MAVAGFVLCGCSPKLRVAVPEGWKVSQEVNENGAQAKVLINEATGATIQVVSDKADASTLPMLAAQTLALVAQVEGQVTELTVADDESSLRISFVAEREGLGVLHCCLVAKLTKKKDRAVATTGVWKDDQDKVVSPAFDQIAASADFR
jgi:hypothetical protein